jgi:LCP family protein required for cell wall assembly
MGIDTRDADSNLGRTDTLILTKFQPAIVNPDVGLLSIPRDLWIDIPSIGENRINTAHFFAESEQPGSGPQATIDVVEVNFGVDIQYFVRIRFEGLKSVVDVLGGVNLNFSRPISGYSAGSHHLNGEQVLAFVRDRQGSDDFFRMERGQLFLKALFRKFLTPSTWLRIPQSIPAIRNAVDTNIPIWQWPRILLTLLRVGPDEMRNFVISRDMVQPFTTSGGAQVLSPNWELIKPMVSEMLGE